MSRGWDFNYNFKIGMRVHTPPWVWDERGNNHIFCDGNRIGVTRPVVIPILSGGLSGWFDCSSAHTRNDHSNVLQNGTLTSFKTFKHSFKMFLPSLSQTLFFMFNSKQVLGNHFMIIH